MAHHPEGPWGVQEKPKPASGDVVTFIGLWVMWIASMAGYLISIGHIIENPDTGEFDIEKGWETVLKFSTSGVYASTFGMFLKSLLFLIDKKKQ